MCHRNVVHARLKPSAQVHAGVGIHDLQSMTEHALNAVDQRIATFVIGHAHAPNVSSEMALADEVAEGRLVERRGEQIECITMLEKPLTEPLRNYQIPHSQRREQNLAERTDVNHAL